MQQTEPAYTSSMAFGLTSCNPNLICADSLPDDSDLLLNRPEYWVVKKEAANSPVAGDELAFTLTPSGTRITQLIRTIHTKCQKISVLFSIQSI